MTFRVIVAGSRGFNDYGFLASALDNILPEGDVTVISGTARGADRLGEMYAENHGHEVIRIPADWDRHGMSAGYLRNEQMAKSADGCVVFWDGVSKGSKHMIDIAERERLKLWVVKTGNKNDE